MLATAIGALLGLLIVGGTAAVARANREPEAPPKSLDDIIDESIEMPDEDHIKSTVVSRKIFHYSRIQDYEHGKIVVKQQSGTGIRISETDIAIQLDCGHIISLNNNLQPIKCHESGKIFCSDCVRSCLSCGHQYGPGYYKIVRHPETGQFYYFCEDCYSKMNSQAISHNDLLQIPTE